MPNTTAVTAPAGRRGWVYCPICTHTVEAEVLSRPRGSVVKPGQKCPRCSSALDAGYVLRLDAAA